MKILIVNGHLHVGGVERSLVNLLRAFDLTRHQVDLLLFEDLGEYISEIPEGIRVVYWDMKPTYGSLKDVLFRSLKEKRPSWFFIKIILLLGNKISPVFFRALSLFRMVDAQYDCAIAYRVGLPLDYVAYTVSARVKCVWWHHGSFNYDKSIVRKWNNAFKNVQHVVCVSHSIKDMIMPFFPGIIEKMTVIPNMIDIDRITRAADCFNPYSENKGKTILVSIGRMSSEKHMEDTVHVMKALVSRGYSDLLWYLVGDGPQREQIEKTIHRFGLEDYFALVGNQSNPYPYLKYADLFIHPSWVESQGIAVLEAMAFGKLCVVVRSEGTNEYIVDGYNATLAEKSTDDMIDKIESMLLHLREIDYSEVQKNTLKMFLPERIIHLVLELGSETKENE